MLRHTYLAFVVIIFCLETLRKIGKF